MTKTVLIVEDDPASAKLFKELMRIAGHKPIHADSGWEAMKLALEYPPDLIIMDIQLPHISGMEISKLLKDTDQFRDVPIIAVTAFSREWTEQKCLEVGCSDFLSKPIAVPAFLQVVAKHLSDPRQENQPSHKQGNLQPS